MSRRSDVAVDIDVPTPPFWGDRIVKGISLADVAAYLDERATFMGQWGLKGSRNGVSYEELVEAEGRPGYARGWTASRPTRSRSSPWSMGIGPVTAKATTSSCSWSGCLPTQPRSCSVTLSTADSRALPLPRRLLP